jgi:hypothetical protein
VAVILAVGTAAIPSHCLTAPAARSYPIRQLDFRSTTPPRRNTVRAIAQGAPLRYVTPLLPDLKVPIGGQNSTLQPKPRNQSMNNW